MNKLSSVSHQKGLLYIKRIGGLTGVKIVRDNDSWTRVLFL